GLSGQWLTRLPRARHAGFSSNKRRRRRRRRRPAGFAARAARLPGMLRSPGTPAAARGRLGLRANVEADDIVGIPLVAVPTEIPERRSDRAALQRRVDRAELNELVRPAVVGDASEQQ